MLANFCLALSSGVMIGFLGLMSTGGGLAISTSTLGFGSGTGYSFFLDKVDITFRAVFGRGKMTEFSSVHKG